MSESIEIVGARFVIEGLDTVEKGLASMGSAVDGAKRRLTSLGDGAGTAAGGLSAASAATANLGKAADTSSAKLDGAKRVLQGMGGPVGELGGRIENLAAGFGKLGGPAGAAALAAVALAGTAAAVAGSTRAIVEATRAARDYLVELEAVQHIEGFGVLDEQADAILAANDALDSMDLATKSFEATLTSRFSPAVEAGAELVIKAELALRDALEVVDNLATSWPNLTAAIEGGLVPIKALGFALTGPVGVVAALADLSDALPGLNGNLGAYQAEVDAVRVATANAALGVWDMTKGTEQLTFDMTAGVKAAGENTTATRDLGNQADKATEQVLALARSMRSDVVSAADAAGFAWLDAQDKLDSLAAAGADAAAVETARAEATKALTRELTTIELDSNQARMDSQAEYYAAWSEGLTAQGGEISAAFDAAFEAYVADADAKEAEEERKREAMQETLAFAAQSTQTLSSAIAGAYSDMAQAQVESILASGETMADGQEKLSQAQRKELERVFERQQSVALASALVNAAAGAVLTLSTVPFPASVPLVAALAIETGREIAAIERQEPPRLHSGYAPDEAPAKLLRSEGVLTPQGVAAAGGSDGIRRLNAGGGGAQSMRIDHMYGHRVLSRQWVDASRMPGPIRDSLRSAASLPTGRSGTTTTTDPGSL